MEDFVASLTIFALALFLGFETITKVPQLLHIKEAYMFQRLLKILKLTNILIQV